MATNDDGLNTQATTTTERDSDSASKQRYEAPQLVEFGKVEEITRGDVGSVFDGAQFEP